MTVPTPPEAESVKVPASTKDRSVNSSANNGETKLIRGIQEISREVAEGVYFRLSARQTRILEAAAIGTLISGLSALFTQAHGYTIHFCGTKQLCTRLRVVYPIVLPTPQEACGIEAARR